MEYVFDTTLINITLNEDDIVNHLDKNLVSVLTQNVNDITYKTQSYIPVTLSVNDILFEPYENKGEVISALQNILLEVFTQYYDSEVTYVSVYSQNIANETIHIFTPYTTLNVPLYENPSYSSSININNYIGYTLISTSLLARYVISSLDEYARYNIKYINTPQGYITILPLDSPSDVVRDEIISRIENNIFTLIKEGYFAYPFGIHDLEEYEIIYELCKLYEINLQTKSEDRSLRDYNIIDNKDLSLLICSTSIDFRMTPQEWIRSNLPLIRTGNFPNFTFSFDFSFFNDYIRLYGSSFRNVILKYVAHLAYAKLSDEHPTIAFSVTSIRINEDLSITVALPSYFLVKKFQNYMEEYLRNGIKYIENNENKLSDSHGFVQKLNGSWNIETCKDLREGILKRWIVQQIDPDAYPMIFLDEETDSNGFTQVLIHRSPLTIAYPPGISPFNFLSSSENQTSEKQTEDLKLAEESLMKELRAFYTKCHDNIEAVTLENINEMNLDELLKLIPIEEKGKTYCFSNTTIGNLVQLENPLTRRPLSMKSILTQQYLEDGLRGLFNIGPLFGLYESIPLPIREPINIGIPKITREYVDPNRRDLVGNIYHVEILFENTTTTPLFSKSLPTINLERVSELEEYVNTLWYEGYFLSNWASVVVKYLKPKSLAVLVNSPVLLHASSSIFDGNTALEMLRNAIV